MLSMLGLHSYNWVVMEKIRQVKMMYIINPSIRLQTQCLPEPTINKVSFRTIGSPQQTEFLKKQWLIKHVKSCTEIYHHTTKYLGIANFLSQLATHLDKSYSCINANSPMIVMVQKIMLIQVLGYQNKRNLKYFTNYGK